jgi:hypothetical protein
MVSEHLEREARRHDDGPPRVVTVYRPLDQEEFISRMVDSFPSIYLTTISIIQGLALGLLIQNVFAFISGSSQSGLERWSPLIPYAPVSFLIIIGILWEYYYFVVVYRWSPKLLDTCIPLFLGFFEIGLMFYLTEPRVWWALNVGLDVSAIIAFTHTYRSCKRSMFRSEGLYKFVRSNVRKDITTTILGTTLAIFISIRYSSVPRIGYWSLWDLVGLAYGVLIMVLLFGAHRFVRDLHSQLALSER